MTTNFFRRKPNANTDIAVSAETDDLVPPTDTERVARLGLWTLGIGFGGFLLWAVIAPLDEGVPTQGVISVDTKRKPVQHLMGGTVREVLVKEGQFVEQDQVLIRLSDAMAKTNYESSRQRYYNLRAMEGRLLAEQLGQSEINFHHDLTDAAANGDLAAQQNMQIQQQLLRSRRASLQANLSSMEESIKGQQAQINGYGIVAENRQNQLRLYKDEWNRSQDLIAEGYLPKNRQYELERSISEAAGANAEAISNQASARQSILDLRQRMIMTRSDYNKEIETQLSEVRRDVEPEAEHLKATTKELEATQIKSPASGQVVGLDVQAVGAIVQPGQKLMDIVPRDEKLLLETHIAPHLIDRVKPGDQVDVRFSSFSHTPLLVVDGAIDSISTDVIFDPQGQTPPAYLARIVVTPEGIKKLGKRHMQPGMPVEVIVKTGSRTLLNYLLHPLLKRVAASMKEE
jgi:protease secretion system membrane fusion protein